jgi:two-component system chemotaxis sensor kinase CheA
VSTSSKGLADFIAEATEILEQLGRDLLQLDNHRGQEADPELVNAIFRGAHSLKGLSGMFGQDGIAKLAHTAEDLLDRLRLGKVSLTDEVLDALIESLDAFQGLLTEASRDESVPATSERADRLAVRLEALSSGKPSQGTQDPLDQIELDPAIRAVFTEYEEHRLRENVRKGVSLWKVRAAFDLTDFDKGLADLNGRLKPVGEVISTLPSAQPGDGTGIAFDLIFGTARTEAELLGLMDGLPATVEPIPVKGAKPAPRAAAAPPPAAAAPPPEREPEPAPKPARKKAPKKPKAEAPAPEPVELPFVDIEPGAAAQAQEILSELQPGMMPEPPSAAGLRPESSLRSLTQTVRVDIRKLDTLMNTVGELLLIRGNLARLSEQARQGGTNTGAKLWGQDLHRETRVLERKLDELQKGLLEARMVPLGQVFDKLARLVRRIAREAGKEIDFVVRGEDVELDKLIVEELSDPLMHIIRNSIDHGVEPPEVRARAGKQRRAVISLRAFPKGNHVVIEVSDDGAGIDAKRVREVALERGLITEQEAKERDERELQSLIFLPGFSTAKSVSSLSGRGVGLDVVKTNIAHLSGIIDVNSQRGKGTTFTLTLPVTLAIIRALVVSVSGRPYAVPLNSVIEITSVASEELRTVEGSEVLSLRGQTLPFVRLARLFNHPERPVKRHFVVVVGLAQERLGIAVDELLGQQDIVVKPLGGRLANVRGISGATDLGNRRTVLVLDVGALMEEVVTSERRATEYH